MVAGGNPYHPHVEVRAHADNHAFVFCFSKLVEEPTYGPILQDGGEDPVAQWINTGPGQVAGCLRVEGEIAELHQAAQRQVQAGGGGGCVAEVPRRSVAGA